MTRGEEGEAREIPIKRIGNENGFERGSELEAERDFDRDDDRNRIAIRADGGLEAPSADHVHRFLVQTIARFSKNLYVFGVAVRSNGNLKNDRVLNFSNSRFFGEFRVGAIRTLGDRNAADTSAGDARACWRNSVRKLRAAESWNAEGEQKGREAEGTAFHGTTPGERDSWTELSSARLV
jgi:hypothetical protein